MNTPQQRENSGTHSESHAEIHDRAGLYIGIVALAVAMLALGLGRGDEKALQVQVRQQDEQLAQMRGQVQVLQTQVSDLKSKVDSAVSDAAIAKNNSQKMEARLNVRR